MATRINPCCSFRCSHMRVIRTFCSAALPHEVLPMAVQEHWSELLDVPANFTRECLPQISGGSWCASLRSLSMLLSALSEHAS